MGEVDERVLAMAARLFGRLGYDATTLEMVRGAAGAGAEDSVLLKSGKDELYLAVLRGLYEMESESLEAAYREGDGGIAGLHGLVDAFFDFVIDHPEFAAMWWQRGLKDASDLPPLEQDYPPPLLTYLAERPWPGLPGTLDRHFLSWIIVWTVSGFIHSGYPDETGRRRHADHRPTVALVRARLHDLVTRAV
ncbi:AcrR family transcriptional regulator [Actinocorallia herbida]|uniref:AcrR family transcriptional regulator n=1 Tax=Actinocorallia herbida TaxID=58109 RepID=A0A3N1CXP5_9ACTN|nr:TetR/AcrR family transcriptional regulator [Actinocorallia herbida]ROO86016.1 AcrR family transcriptional regulator [Actinocorallia herbida]